MPEPTRKLQGQGATPEHTCDVSTFAHGTTLPRGNSANSLGINITGCFSTYLDKVKYLTSRRSAQLPARVAPPRRSTSAASISLGSLDTRIRCRLYASVVVVLADSEFQAAGRSR